MYPLMVISRLPPGLSLDWLASGLAQQGIGILPLSTFARTGQGYEAGRKTFRLTLGGTDGAEELKSKTRRVLIDLNRLIAQEASRYNRERYPSGPFPPFLPRTRALTAGWQDVEQQIIGECSLLRETGRTRAGGKVDPEEFQSAYLPERLAAFRLRCADRAAIVEGLLSNGVAGRSGLIEQLGRECTKDSLERRSLAFQNRLYDRTVHPTQMYSIQVERVFERIIGSLIRRDPVPPQDLRLAARELLDEYLGRNVAISSEQESEELVLDLDALIAAEHWQELETGASAPGFISFWGDWDGSNRPSGQGHQLVATTLMTNVARLARLIVFFARAESDAGIDRSLLVEIGTLPEKERRFSRLLNDITRLTHQLERRYRGILPFRIRPSGLRSLGMRLHLARDPLTLLWHHNDRLERRMLELRKRRREALEYYFALNKRLRKQVHALLPRLERQSADHPLVREVLLYRDLLQRMIITPRVHQSMVTAQDSFAIDTTVYNIFEINEIAGRYGNPAMILALQVSMSTKSEALISLDRKMRARREQTLREHPGIALPSVQIIPLFEDAEAIEAIPAYLDKVWEYALQSRRIDQETPDRFAEIISEVFIAGSDISQQVGQAAGASAYHSAKSKFALWLSEHGLVDHVHIKMGSGEPMQRQGGYYAPQSGEPAFNAASPALQDRHAALPAAARKSTEYATTPLMGIFSGGDIRTFQGALSEQLRYLPARELAQVLHHLRVAQQRHRADLSRAAESLSESRLTRHKRVTRELERLTIGTSDPVHDRFTSMVSSDFRQILYGREEDVLGIHVISYFIARATPQLRDRPTVRPESGTDEERGQKILGRIERMIPLATRGSLLRAIAHNQAQTMVLGINQLTTGLFRALHRFSQMEMQEGDPETMIVERVLPRLPVYEILLSLRLYHDPALPWLQEIEAAFPAGNSAFPALREDNDAIQRFIGLLQQELLRRHGLAVDNFFENGVFNPSLLPALRPDLALLMQGDIYNCDMSRLLEGTGGEANGEWLQSIRRTIELPAKIRTLRAKIWEFLKEPIFERVQSFAELAQALHTLSTRENLEVAEERAGRLRISGEISQLMRTARAADEMRDFLLSSVRYLSAISEGMVEVPIAIVRSMREVERIAKIEEHALLPREQELLRCYTLRIARMTGESG
jgi:hypothetical protein